MDNITYNSWILQFNKGVTFSCAGFVTGPFSVAGGTASVVLLI